MMDGLTVGRMAHYVPTDRGNDAVLFAMEEDHLAAVVSQVQDSGKGIVSLTVFRRSGSPVSIQNVPFSAEAKPGCWHWIERA